MKVTVERTFNLGNYENIRFTFEAEVPSKAEFEATMIDLAQRCHIAYGWYNQKLLDLKKHWEAEGQRIAAMLDNGLGGKKP